MVERTAWTTRHADAASIAGSVRRLEALPRARSAAIAGVLLLLLLLLLLTVGVAAHSVAALDSPRRSEALVGVSPKLLNFSVWARFIRESSRFPCQIGCVQVGK